MAVYDAVVVGRGMVGSAAAKYLALSRPSWRIALIGPPLPSSMRDGDGDGKERAASESGINAAASTSSSFPSMPSTSSSSLPTSSSFSLPTTTTTTSTTTPVTTTVYSQHHDEGRITRVLDRDSVWGQLAAASILRYRELEQESGINFFEERGFLAVLPVSAHSSLRQRLDIARQQHIPVETLSHTDLEHHYPFLRPYAHASKGNVGLLQRHHAGYVNPRRLVAAQVAMARSNGVEVWDETVREIVFLGPSPSPSASTSTSSFSSFSSPSSPACVSPAATTTTTSPPHLPPPSLPPASVCITSTSGKTWHSQRVIIACGSFTPFLTIRHSPSFSPSISPSSSQSSLPSVSSTSLSPTSHAVSPSPSPPSSSAPFSQSHPHTITTSTPVTLYTQLVLLVELSLSDTRRLHNMPTMIVDGESEEQHTYILPPITYPDGKTYMKLGHGATLERPLHTDAEVCSWYRKEGEHVQKGVAHLSHLFHTLFPTLSPLSFRADTCVTDHTPNRRPVWEEVGGGVGVVVWGGNGYAAKSSDEIGRRACDLLLREHSKL